MDHNLEDSLTAMGVDFEQSEDVVTQADISLDTAGPVETIPMEFERIEEQPILMDTGNDEIIDFMGEQFTLQDYAEADDQVSTVSNVKMEGNQEQFPAHSEDSVDLQLDEHISVPASGVIIQEMQLQPKNIAVKPQLQPMRAIAPKKETVVLTKAIPPRQVAIAPKPPKLTQSKQATLIAGKQYTIAPKPLKAGVRPVTLIANKSAISLMKGNSVSSAQDAGKGNTVLAQLGKHLLMVPSAGQKIKLVAAQPPAAAPAPAPAPATDPAGGAPASGVSAVRLIHAGELEELQLGNSQTAAGTQGPKQVMTKVIVQAGSGKTDIANQSAVLTKLVSSAGAAGVTSVASSTPARYVTVQQKFGKVLVTSPNKPGVRFAKKQQVLAIKSPTPKLMPVSTQQGTTKKVVITANPTQNVILRTTAPPKAGHITKAGTQRTQLHQINVPGKGIQYIRLVTNPQPTQKQPAKPVTSNQASTFVLTDREGNVIQMSAEKMGTPPPLLVTGNVAPKPKPPQKLVRIAPVTWKGLFTPQQSQARGKSLLAPLSPQLQAQAPAAVQHSIQAAPAPAPAVPYADLQPVTTQPENASEDSSILNISAPLEEATMEEIVLEETDSKCALQALIADTVGSDADVRDSHDTHREHTTHTVSQDISYDTQPSPDADSMERAVAAGDESVIVIPSYMKHDVTTQDDVYDNSQKLDSTMINVEVDPYNAYQSPNTPQLLSESDMVSSDLSLRARKACNCTKSQCLKLYCDCFANGEFCNRCNCINCHNNLDNEELRQQAIRGCLDRNPNAFRPKIGKSKAGGPEIIRRHNKGCNCKRSGCLKNYCECYEAKIACTSICKCVGCRNVEETLERGRGRPPPPPPHPLAGHARPRPRALRPPAGPPAKQPCSFMTTEVIEAVCQCLLAAAVEGDEGPAVPASTASEDDGPLQHVLDEFARCLQDIISASHHAAPLTLLDDAHA